MITKRIVSITTILVLMVMSILSGCSSSSSGGENSKIPVITYAFPVVSNMPKDIQQVENEINKISIKEINVKVKLKPIGIANWNQQVNLMVTSQDQLDLMPTLGTFTTMVSQNQLTDMTGLLNKYGQGIKMVLGDNLLKGTTVNGKVYGVTVGNGKAAVPSILMRKDILDKNGLSAKNVTSLNDIAKIFDVISEKEPQMSMLVPGQAGTVTLAPNFLLMNPNYDPLGDGLGVLLGNDNYKVVNLYETSQYNAVVQTMREWYQKGYIMKDASTTTETAQSLLKEQKGFSTIMSMEVGGDAAAKQGSGFPFFQVKLQAPLLTSSSANSLTWVMPVTSKNPEAAMKFLNLTYTNPDIVNLLDWGIEGKHYVKKPDGTITYPDGVNASNDRYGLGENWLFGNQFISYVWEGNDPNNYKILAEDNKTAPVSNALGFSYDPKNVKTELAAVSNVIKQYTQGLETGSLDPNKTLPKFISALKAAGIEKIIAEKQKQLDVWVKANQK